MSTKYIGDVVMHRVPAEVEGSYEDYYFPINHNQLRNLLGQLLTQVDSMNLPAASSKATKQIITKLCWEWFDDVMDNSATSCPTAGLLPIKPSHPVPDMPPSTPYKAVANPA